MPDSNYAEVSSDAHPLIHVRFTGVKSTDDNFSKYLQDVKSCYNRNERIAIIFDATKASLPKYTHINMQATWLKDNEKLMSDLCAGTAYIIPNGMVRGALNMIFALQKQPVPYTIVASNEKALAWIKSVEESPLSGNF